MSPLLEILATLAAGLFTGAALYVTAVEHPARVSCGSALAVTEFRPSYERGAIMQATLALTGALAAMVRWGLGGQIGWLIGGLLPSAERSVPDPTNRVLISFVLTERWR